ITHPSQIHSSPSPHRRLHHGCPSVSTNATPALPAGGVSGPGAPSYYLDRGGNSSLGINPNPGSQVAPELPHGGAHGFRGGPTLGASAGHGNRHGKCASSGLPCDGDVHPAPAAVSSLNEIGVGALYLGQLIAPST
ncbi:unnamed protein product, partial [Urochloa humidicola]